MDTQAAADYVTDRGMIDTAGLADLNRADFNH